MKTKSGNPRDARKAKSGTTVLYQDVTYAHRPTDSFQYPKATVNCTIVVNLPAIILEFM